MNFLAPVDVFTSPGYIFFLLSEKAKVENVYQSTHPQTPSLSLHTKFTSKKINSGGSGKMETSESKEMIAVFIFGVLKNSNSVSFRLKTYF